MKWQDQWTEHTDIWTCRGCQTLHILQTLFFLCLLLVTPLVTFNVSLCVYLHQNKACTQFFLQVHRETNRYLPTTTSSSAFVALYFTDSSNLRSVTSSPRTQSLCINLNIDGVLWHSSLPLTKLTRTSRLLSTSLSSGTLYRHPSPDPPTVCESSTSSGFTRGSLCLS